MTLLAAGTFDETCPTDDKMRDAGIYRQPFDAIRDQLTINVSWLLWVY
jgi:hypothetical protein